MAEGEDKQEDGLHESGIIFCVKSKTTMWLKEKINDQVKERIRHVSHETHL